MDRHYPDDPAGNFASDAHRRVMTAVPNAEQGPKDADAIIEWYNRTSQDALLLSGVEMVLSGEEILSILSDLEADGDVTHTEDGWVITNQGHEVGIGPTARDGGRKYYE